MLFLLFRIGSGGYALDASQIVEIIPLVDLTAMRQSPPAVSGLCEYRGRFVPVIDLCVLELDRQAYRRLSTRIIVVRHPADNMAPIGLIAENVTEMLRLDPAAFSPFAQGPHGFIQRIELKDLLPATLLTVLGPELVSSQ